MSLVTTSNTTTTTTGAPPEESSFSRIRQESELVQRYILDLGPAFRYSHQMGSAVIVSARQFLQLNRIALTYLLLGCNVVALQAILFARDLAAAAATIISNAWDSKPGRRLRKKLEFEFFVLILGCGNSVLLVFLWPGWIVLGVVYMLYLISCWAG